MPFRRQRRFLAQRLLEFGTEERVLHSAVDDVPRQDRVGRPIAEHEEVGIDAGIQVYEEIRTRLMTPVQATVNVNS